MERIKRISAVIDKILTVLCCIMLVGSIACVFISVLDRYVLKVSLFWTEEAARFFFTWLAMVAPGIMILRHGHYDMTFFVDLWLPPKPRKILAIVIKLVCLVAVCAGAWYGYRLMIKLQRQRMPTLPFSIKYWYMSIPVGMCIMAVTTVLTLIEDVIEVKGMVKG